MRARSRLPVEADPVRRAAGESGAGWTRRSGLLLAAICLVAAALRLAHLQQIAAHDPFFDIPAVDGRLYDAWARRIAAGQIFEDQVLILGPLYPHFLALVHAVWGPSFFAVKLVQAALGVLSCALLAWLAREHFEPRVALLAAALAALSPMLIFYGGTLMVVNVQVPLLLLVLIAVTRALRSPTSGRWLLSGLLVGLSGLARQTTLLFAPLAVAGLAWRLRERVRPVRIVGLAVLFCLGIALPILPFTLHNLRAGDDFVLVNSTGGANLYMGNNPRSTGVWSPPRISRARVDNPLAMREAFTEAAEARLGRGLKPSEVSAYWSRQALGYVVQQPGAWLALELRKLLLFVNGWEVWNNRSIDISREFSWVLRLPLPTFAWIAPFGLLGMVLCARRFGELFPLYAMLATYLAAALVFFVLSRYRMPAATVLMVFAASAIVTGVDAAQQRAYRKLALLAAGLLAFAVLVNLPLRADNLYMAYFNLGNKYKSLSDWDRAIDSYQKSLARNPGFISTHNNLALAYEGAGATEQAVEAWRRVLAWSIQRGDRKRIERATRHLESLGAAPEPETPRGGDG